MSFKKDLKTLLAAVKDNKVSVKTAYRSLETLPYKNLDFARLDHHRTIRKGFAEVVYCEGKTNEHIKKILKNILKKNKHILLTRANKGLFNCLQKYHKDLRYNEVAKVIYLKKKPPKNKKTILILSAGTSDIPVAEEAKITSEVMGNSVKVIYDVGVAGIHRLFDKLKDIRRSNVIIVVAGMDGALASVVGGLTSKPVIAVPTSVGYGSTFKGVSALLTMINSCAPGVTVVNIDNGFGAGYFASLINR
ncbi:MAG: nickel pincer cofactor biosynthesis protein LarB [Candidatus Omnitrophota bacterium]